MRIDWWTLGLQTINLLVLVWILGRFLFRPVADIIARRQAEAAQLLEDAQKAKAKAQEAEQAADKAAADAAASRHALLEAATGEAAKEKEKLVAAARGEADRVRTEAEAEIARLRDQEIARCGARASRLAVDIARRMFERLPDAARISGFVDGLAQGLGALPPAAREELGAHGQAVPILAARALDAEEEQALRRAIGTALGRDVTLAVTAAPALIAGLEIETAHAAVRNSFRDDLNRISAELTRDEPA